MSDVLVGDNLLSAITCGIFDLIPVAPVPGEINTFDEILVDNAPIYLGIFGVDGIYRPGVLDREIQVIIRYVTDDGQVAPVVRHRSPIAYIKVANDPVTGISAEEFMQGHEISLPPRKGADVRVFSLARILKQDAGLITIEVH